MVVHRVELSPLIAGPWDILRSQLRPTKPTGAHGVLGGSANDASEVHHPRSLAEGFLGGSLLAGGRRDGEARVRLARIDRPDAMSASTAFIQLRAQPSRYGIASVGTHFAVLGQDLHTRIIAGRPDGSRSSAAWTGGRWRAAHETNTECPWWVG